LGPFWRVPAGGRTNPVTGQWSRAGAGWDPQKKGPFRALGGPLAPFGGQKGPFGGGPGQRPPRPGNRPMVPARPRQGGQAPPTPPGMANSGTFGALRAPKHGRGPWSRSLEIVVHLGPHRELLMGGGQGSEGRKTSKNTKNRENPLKAGLVGRRLGKGVISGWETRSMQTSRILEMQVFENHVF